ncbi:gamma-type small acid-soluble spore protein [Halalkalibacter krulwichiae]|uniref:Small, acid-soluble spore protein gamma-type n=1 Tax=Halalkalibacter krulwichiae TaxID=199441 RepID=A0A1X9M6G3_9BACI|nr:gamma-type small acid-soluble spore protein [Halalkalibacter krulwichiae]ARK29028.1 Small, acid-soluble spore protein gamma-type [Halalkalibacter krulwichiae]
MDRQQQQASKTNAQQVRRQNAASAQGADTEFASETDVQEVRQQNAQSQARKQQNSSRQQ